MLKSLSVLENCFKVLWSDIEPKEGEFRWDVFDSVAQNWIRAGKQMAIRIICCNQTVNATPDWVREAGCKGIWFKYRSETAQPRWEPVYDDPVFVAKYSNFLKAFAARYDGNASVAFVDVGSLGMYGEGHTGDTSKLSRAETDRLARLHIDLHRKYLPNTYLVISDDVAGSQSKAKELPPLLEYALANGVGFRDDSPGVTLEELSRFFASRGCRQAYNLDGGSSTHLWFHGDERGWPSEPAELADFIYVEDLSLEDRS